MTDGLPFDRVFRELEEGEDGDLLPGILLVGHGQLQLTDQRELAQTYGAAAGLALDRARRDLDLGPHPAYPALFLIRHAVELYLKAIVPDWDAAPDRRNRHRIDTLLATMQGRMEGRYDAAQVEALCGFHLRFHDLDPKAMAFRYRDGATASFADPAMIEPEIWIDLAALREAVSVAFDALALVWLMISRKS
ncbi:MAG: hypothetical protein ACU0CO_07115 [Shimia sp.]